MTEARAVSEMLRRLLVNDAHALVEEGFDFANGGRVLRVSLSRNGVEWESVAEITERDMLLAATSWSLSGLLERHILRNCPVWLAERFGLIVRGPLVPPHDGTGVAA